MKSPSYIRHKEKLMDIHGAYTAFQQAEAAFNQFQKLIPTTGELYTHREEMIIVGRTCAALRIERISDLRPFKLQAAYSAYISCGQLLCMEMAERTPHLAHHAMSFLEKLDALTVYISDELMNRCYELKSTLRTTAVTVCLSQAKRYIEDAKRRTKHNGGSAPEAYEQALHLLREVYLIDDPKNAEAKALEDQINTALEQYVTA